MSRAAASGGLLERAGEVAALSRALAGARDGAGSAVLVEGPAGIGKSSLLAVARDEAEREGMTVLAARGLELEQDATFELAVDLLAAPLGAASAQEKERLLVGQAGLAASLLMPAAAAPAATLDPQALIRGLYWLTVNLVHDADGSTRPLAIVVDDIHWCDRASLAFVAHLAARLGELPIALLAALRTGEPTAAADVIDAIRDAAAVTSLTPAALSEQAVGQLVADELSDPAAEFVRACARVSGGNPFMTRELARALRDDGITPAAESVGRVQQLIPASVLRSVLTRLARLGDASQRTAAALSVLGDGAPLRRVAALAALDSRAAEHAADALAEAEILAAGEPLRFAHPLIAGAVHADLPTFARARAHRDAASLLAREGAALRDVAAHLLLSTPEGDPWVTSQLRAAAAEALAQGDSRAAARLLERALAEPPGQAEIADLLVELAGAEAAHGDRRSESHLSEALALLGDSPKRVDTLRTLSRVAILLEDNDRAAAALKEILQTVGPDDPAAEEILAEYVSANTFRTPMSAEAERQLAPLIERAARGEAPKHPGLIAHLALRLALSGAPAPTIRELAQRAVADESLVVADGYGLFVGILVQSLCMVDELELAERIASDAVAVAVSRGSLFAAASYNFHRAIARYHRGALADALADTDQALAPSREGWDAGAAWVRSLQAQVLLERDDLPGAQATLAQSDPAPDSMEYGIVLLSRAKLALATGDPSTALRCALDSGRKLSEGFAIDHPGLAPWRATAALAALALGDRDHAVLLGQEGLERASWAEVPRAIAQALRIRSELTDGTERIDLLREAAAALEHSPAQLERAHVLGALGSALRLSGDRAGAQPVLREALELADRFGARALAEAARAQLRATGARPRRAAQRGTDALTPAERRVAQLASRGLTNRAIAEHLFITTKTVETHLAHAYQKLEISSRRQLAGNLEAV